MVVKVAELGGGLSGLMNEAGALRPRILIVDDDAGFRELMKDWLSGGYELCLARNGEEGFRMGRTERPDLILLDLMMPRLLGESAAWLFANDGFFTGVPVAYVSAAPASLPRGALGLAKPFSLEQMMDLITRGLQSGGTAGEAFGAPAGAHGPTFALDSAIEVSHEGRVAAGRVVFQLLWGACIEVEDAPPTGSWIGTAFVGRRPPLHLEGRVVHGAPDRSRIGIRFRFASAMHERAYAELLGLPRPDIAPGENTGRGEQR